MPIAQQPSPILEPRSVSTLLPVDLPAPPISVVRVLEACSSGRADARELASVIGTDPVMTAEVLRIANSAYIGIANEVRSVRHAISAGGATDVAKLRVVRRGTGSPQARSAG